MISLFEGNDGRTLAARITRLTGIKVMKYICTCLILTVPCCKLFD